MWWCCIVRLIRLLNISLFFDQYSNIYCSLLTTVVDARLMLCFECALSLEFCLAWISLDGCFLFEMFDFFVTFSFFPPTESSFVRQNNGANKPAMTEFSIPLVISLLTIIILLKSCALQFEFCINFINRIHNSILYYYHWDQYASYLWS